MTALFNPETWSGWGAPALALMVAVVFVVALLRGWIVLGPTHRAEVARLDARADKDADTIAILSNAVIEKNATDTATTRIIASMREAAIAAAGDG